MDATLRVGDEERSSIVDDLRTHTAAGRLSLEEFSSRSRSAYAARTRAELESVVGDLPELPRDRPAPESGNTLLWVLGAAVVAVLLIAGFAGVARLLG